MGDRGQTGTVPRKRQTPPTTSVGGVREIVRSNYSDVLSFLALTAWSDVEFDGLTFIEALVAFARDIGIVDEYIVTTLT